MVEKISSVTRVQRLSNYDDQRQSPKDNLKKKPKLDFQNVLNQKMAEKNTIGSAPYHLNISRW